MILSKATIKDLLASGALVIEPAPPPEAYGPDSVGLRLGDTVYIPRHDTRPRLIDDVDDCYIEEESPEVLLLFPGARRLITTLERVILPNDVAAQIVTRSRYARAYVEAVGASCFIHAGFDGHIILEVRNDGPFTVILPKHESICSIVFTYLDQPSEGYQGRYQGQEGL